MRDDEFHEFNLDGKQLVFLFMSATVVAVVVFLCGVMVGRGVRTPQAGEPVEFAAAGAVDPVDGPAPGESLDVASPPPKESTPLSYDNRLGSETSPPEVLREPAPLPAPRPVAESAAVAAPAPATASPRPSASPKPTARGSYFVQVAAVTGNAEAERKRKELPQSYSTNVVQDDSMFKVRVGPYATKKEADAVAARLRRQRKYRDAWVTK